MERKININGKEINQDSDAWVVAEIGHNYGGDDKKLERLLALIKSASECGCDAVKVQKRDNKTLYTKTFYNSLYNSEHAWGRTYGEHREALELNKDEFIAAKHYARGLGLQFFSTAFDIPSAEFLAELDVRIIKVASADIKNLPLLRCIAGDAKVIIMSTGGASLDDIRRAEDCLSATSTQRAYLHCIASYPNQPDELNLAFIAKMLDEFQDKIIGFSDHYNGICMAEVAYVMGARIIEKHFTLDHTWKGSDNALSLQPDGMKRLVRDLRRIRKAMVAREKRLLNSEIPGLQKMAKSIYLARSLSAGTEISNEEICLKTPWELDAIEPYQIDEVKGKILINDYSTARPLKWKDLKGEE